MTKLKDLIEPKQITHTPLSSDIERVKNRARKIIDDADKMWIVAALNYAINTVHNKKEVKEKKENSMWYRYFTNWTRIQKQIEEVDTRL